MSLSLLCLTYRRPEYFERMALSVDAAVALLQASTDEAVQKICVNQDPADTVTPARAIARGWEVWTPGANLSFSEGNNRAAQLATGTHLVLINNDLVLDERALLRMHAARGQAPIVGVVVRRFKDGLVTHGGGDLDAKGLPFHHDRDVPFVPRDGVRGSWWTTFACALIDVRAWTRLGGLDETYKYGYEDLDFCLRAQEKQDPPSQSAVVVPLDAIVWHDEHGTRKPDEDVGNFDRWCRRWHTQGGRLVSLRERAAIAGRFSGGLA